MNWECRNFFGYIEELNISNVAGWVRLPGLDKGQNRYKFVRSSVTNLKPELEGSWCAGYTVEAKVQWTPGKTDYTVKSVTLLTEPDKVLDGFGKLTNIKASHGIIVVRGEKERKIFVPKIRIQNRNLFTRDLEGANVHFIAVKNFMPNIELVAVKCHLVTDCALSCKQFEDEEVLELFTNFQHETSPEIIPVIAPLEGSSIYPVQCDLPQFGATTKKIRVRIPMKAVDTTDVRGEILGSPQVMDDLSNEESSTKKCDDVSKSASISITSSASTSNLDEKIVKDFASNHADDSRFREFASAKEHSWDTLFQFFRTNGSHSAAGVISIEERCAALKESFLKKCGDDQKFASKMQEYGLYHPP